MAEPTETLRDLEARVLTHSNANPIDDDANFVADTNANVVDDPNDANANFNRPELDIHANTGQDFDSEAPETQIQRRTTPSGARSNYLDYCIEDQINEKEADRRPASYLDYVEGATESQMKEKAKHTKPATVPGAVAMDKGSSKASYLSYCDDPEAGEHTESVTDSSVSTPRGRSRRESLPGAFRESAAVGGSSAELEIDPALAGPEEPTPTPSSARPPAIPEAADTSEPIVNSSDGLAVARTVEEGDQAPPQDLDLPRAAFQEEETRRRSNDGLQDSKKSPILKMCPLMAVVAIIALVIIVVSFSGKKDKETPAPVSLLSPTSAPSAAPVSVVSYLYSLLPDYTVRRIDIDPTSPQAIAFEWLTNDTEINDYSNLSPQRIIQRYSLATFYLASGGDQWNNNAGWLNHTLHECYWYNNPEFALKSIFSAAHIMPGFFTEFYPPTEPQPSICNPDGIYEHLWLDNNGLVGSSPIPLELYLLTSLVTISVGLNGLQGPISTHIGQMTNLEGFLVTLPGGEPGRSGELPSEFGLLPKLKGLSISNSGFHGSIPTQLGLLTNLQTILFGRNSFHGALPDVTLFPKLRWIVIDGSDMTGTIPTEIGTVSTLEWLALGRNQLTGTLPSQLGKLDKLFMLSLTSNELEGTVPTQLGLMTSSTLLTLRGNQLSGPIPSQMGMLTRLADTFSIMNNPMMTGTLPTQLGRLTNVYSMALSNNNHTGPIPTEFSQLTALGRLEMANNDFTGTVPEMVSHNWLYKLDISGNALLSGTIPDSFCQLNATCIPTSLRLPCTEPLSSYDCSALLCGCGCSCGNDTMLSNATEFRG